MSERRRIVAAVCLLVLAPAVVWGAQFLRLRNAPPHGVSTASSQATITPTPAASLTAPLQTPSAPAAIATPPAVPSGSPRPPAQATASVLWGLWEPHWQTNGTTDPTAYTRVEAELGHRADLIHWYANWDEGWDYDGGLVNQVIRSQRTPMITWEAWNRPLGAIAAGQFDGYIDSWAKGMAAYSPHPVFVRIFHEFNDPQAGDSGYPWGVAGGNANRPADLVAAWRHIHDRFVAAGANNVRFIWCPDGVNLDFQRLQTSYPGDGYVDFAGWDTYGYDTATDYQTLGRITQKPVVLAEVGTTDPAWVSDLTSKLRLGAYGRVRALVWFDEGSSQLDANLALQPALRAMLSVLR
jgi:Glycosyl hydrolase family 26